MNTISEADRIRDLITEYIKCNESSNWEMFVKIWHPEARRLNVGNSNDLFITPTEDIKKYSFEGLKNLRKQVPDAEIRFTIKEITHLDVHDDVVASAEVKWKMFLPGSEGTHKTYFHLVKLNGNWTIVSVLDRGFEES